jgi:hypothetical protein
MDLEANRADVEGVTYELQTASGGTVRYTLPYGARIPSGAVCVCNYVAGYQPECSCVGHVSLHYWYPN